MSREFLRKRGWNSASLPVIFLISAILISITILFTLFNTVKAVSEISTSIGECGSSMGPFYGDTVILKPDSFDILMAIPKGSLGIVNSSNDKTPVLFRLDETSTISWAIQLHTGDKEYRVRKMSSIQLDTTEKSVTFFNVTLSEPGRISLSKTYDFEYFCLSPL